MAILYGKTSAVEVSIEARIIRADGRIEDLGAVAYWNRNPFKRLAWRIRRLFARH